MQELLERVFTELRNVWRFRWQALLVGWFVALAGWFFVYSLPNQYVAHAKVHVDTESILRPLLHGLAVQSNLNNEVRLLTRTLLSRQNLERIARKSNLDLGGLSAQAKDALLRELAGEIQLRNAGQDVYLISYENAKPAVAQAVVQEVLNIMMSEALGTTAESSTSAQKFLKMQVANYASQLNAAQEALAKFKRDNIDYLPSQGDGNYFSQLQSAQHTLGDLKNKLSLAQAQYSALKSQTRPMLQPDSDPLIAALNKSVLDDEHRLNILLAEYTPQYPAVIDLKERIRLEKQQRKAMVKKFMQGGGQEAQPNSIAYQDLLQQQSEAMVQIQTIRQKIKQTRTQIAQIKSSADKLTNADVRLEALTRNYNVTRKQYDQLLSRLYSAELSQTAQASGNPLKFQVIDPPVRPVLPAGPKRRLMAFLVLLASLAAGFAFAYISAMLKPVFMTRSELSEILALPVIGAISLATTEAYQQARRFGVVGFSVVLALLVVTGGAAVIFANHGAELVRVKLMGGTL